MKKLFILIFLLASISLQAQNVPDLIRTTPVPTTGANKNNRATVDANLKAGLSFLPPKGNAYSLNGAKDSAGYLYFNDILRRLGIYRGAGIWDNPLNVVTTSYQNLNINEKVQVITDATANFGKSLYLPSGSTDPGVRPIYGPYLGLENGEYTYKFYLKINTNLTDTARFLHVDIAENGNSIMSTFIRYSDFIGANVWTPFRIVFNGVKGRNYECRIDVVHGSDPYPAQYPTKTNLWYDYGQIIGIREFVPTDLGVYATHAYVDTAISHIPITSYTFSNGLTKTGNNVKLGGPLIDDTSIGSNNKSFDIGGIYNNSDYYDLQLGNGAQLTYAYNYNKLLSQVGALAGAAVMSIGQYNFPYHGQEIRFDGNTMSIKDELSNKGLQYNQDYSANGKLDDRWIPDWGAVKSIIPASIDTTTLARKTGSADMIQKSYSLPYTASVTTPSIGYGKISLNANGSLVVNKANGYTRTWASTYPGATTFYPAYKAITHAADSADVANIYARKDTVKNNAQSYVTTVYDKQKFTDLNDFDVFGTAPTINTATNRIVMSGGDGTLNNYIKLKALTNNSRNQDYEVYYKAIDVSGAGIQTGRKSINTTGGGTLNGYATYDLVNNTLLVGNLAATASNLTVNAGDNLVLKISMRQDVLISATITDITQANATFSLLDRTYQVNTGDPVIFNLGGNTEISRIRLVEYNNPNANIYTFTDSKFLLPYKQNIPFYLDKLGTVSVFGGQSDKSNEMLAAAPYMIKYMKPSTVYFHYLRNDLIATTPLSSASQANYIATVNLFKAAGWKVIHVLPIPETTITDQSSINTFINGEPSFSSDGKIDPSVGFSTANYVNGIHLNDVGSPWVADLIVNAGLSPRVNTLQPDNYIDSKAYDAKINQPNIWNYINKFMNVSIGNRSSADITSSTGIYSTTTGGSGIFPFNGVANTVWSSRGNANSNHVIMGNGVVKNYILDATNEFNHNYTDGLTHASNGSNFNVNGIGSFTNLTLSALTASKAVFTTSTKLLTTTGPGTSSQFLMGDGSLNSLTYVPTTRTITTTLPLSGGGDLSANRTLGIGGLTAYGTANQVLGMNAAATGYEYKTITAGTNVSVTQGVNSITIAATGNPVVEISGTTQAAAANTIYIPHNAALTSITMPTTTVIGSLYQVIGEGAGGWKLILPTGAVAVGVGGFTTTSGGSLSSTDRYCTITIRLIATNKFSVTTSQGTITPL